MASRMARMAPRSVLDATRFTSTLPHAASKTAVVGRVASPAASKQSPRVPGETPEQRVQRLRKAHQAAQQAQISSVDRMVEGSRKFFDAAHRWTVRALIFFTSKRRPLPRCIGVFHRLWTSFRLREERSLFAHSPLLINFITTSPLPIVSGLMLILCH